MQDTKRLFFFTGKGGVGKSTLAQAFCLHLKKQGLEFSYLTYDDHALNIHPDLIHAHTKLNLKNCMQDYLTLKLHSKVLATLLLKTPFFHSLMEIIPGFSYLTYIGAILKSFQDQPKKFHVIDTAASGHALSFFSSLDIFKKIFSKGPLVNDMNDLLSSVHERAGAVICINLPTDLSQTESEEFKQAFTHTHFPLSLFTVLNQSTQELPSSVKEIPYMAQRVEQEKNSPHECFFPMIPSHSFFSVISTLGTQDSLQPHWRALYDVSKN
jgi:anion-transporting  ArsA/GET3 family ATPase